MRITPITPIIPSSDRQPRPEEQRLPENQRKKSPKIREGDSILGDIELTTELIQHRYGIVFDQEKTPK